MVHAIEISIHPNPAYDNIYLSYGAELLVEAVQLADITGRRVKSFSPESKVLNISSLARGTYILKMSTMQGVASKKIVIW